MLTSSLFYHSTYKRRCYRNHRYVRCIVVTDTVTSGGNRRSLLPLLTLRGQGLKFMQSKNMCVHCGKGGEGCV